MLTHLACEVGTERHADNCLQDLGAGGQLADPAGAGVRLTLQPTPPRPGTAVTAQDRLPVAHLTCAAMVRAHSIDSASAVSTSRS